MIPLLILADTVTDALVTVLFLVRLWIFTERLKRETPPTPFEAWAAVEGAGVLASLDSERKTR